MKLVHGYVCRIIEVRVLYINHALVVVPDNKLSLAIGRRGQNVRLAAHLTGYRIDIKSASEFEEMEAAQETFEDQVESGEEQVD